MERLISMAHAYYILDDPIATDSEYDALYHEVLHYERANPEEVLPNSPTQRVGSVLEDGFVKIEHLSRMWSLDDVFSEDEMSEFISKIQNGLGNNLLGADRYNKFFEAVKVLVAKISSIESIEGGTILRLEADGEQISVVTEAHLKSELVGRLVCVAVNLKPKKILGHMSYGRLVLVDSKNGLFPLVVDGPADGCISSKCW